MQIVVLGYAKAESGTATILNALRQDIERAIFSVATLGLTEVTRLSLSTVEKWQDDQGQNAIIRVTFVATYRYSRGSP